MGTGREHPTGAHRLGPHVIGQRVVVRHLLPGEIGPSGAPAATDVLGVCLAWGDGFTTIRRDNGAEAVIRIADIVSGKPVPPRASVRHRVSPQTAQVRALAMWPQVDTVPLGDWTLRWSSTSPARRANSVLAMTEPGVEDPVRRVVEHYSALGRRPMAMVLPGSPQDGLFGDHGWAPESPDQEGLFQLAGVAAARRLLDDRPAFAVTLEESSGRVRAHVGGDATALGSVARDWLGIGAMVVAGDRRRRGMGIAMVAALLDWGAEQGATTAYLQVLSDNLPALALYDRLGFRTHHTYRYLAAPDR